MHAKNTELKRLFLTDSDICLRFVKFKHIESDSEFSDFFFKTTKSLYRFVGYILIVNGDHRRFNVLNMAEFTALAVNLLTNE